MGWPYWSPIPFSSAPRTTPLSASFPLDPKSAERLVPTPAQWNGLGATVQETIRTNGLAQPHTDARGFGVGAFYLRQSCDGVPSLITLDALIAVTFVAVEAALAEVERQVSAPAMRTVLAHLDRRLAAAEPGAHPDLLAGLHMAEGVVAVGMSLLDPSYAPPNEVKAVVTAELVLVHGHAGLTPSPVLHVPIDYAAFGLRGAATELAAGPYLAAQWLTSASFAFGAAEKTSHVDMSGARARTRGALLIARLFSASEDDGDARRALFDADRLGDLAFGQASTVSPDVLATFATKHGFDPHDSNAIAAAGSVDRIRRLAEATFGSMQIMPLPLAPDALAFSTENASDASAVDPRGSDVVAFLTSPTWKGGAAEHHASFALTALDAISTWLGPSEADGSIAGAGTPEWSQRKAAGAVAAWSILRHSSVPFARVLAHADATVAPPACLRPTAPILVEPHPEAIAALLAYVRQVTVGLSALRAGQDAGPPSEILALVDRTLEVALNAALDEEHGAAGFAARAEELSTLPKRLAEIEGRTAPVAGPFAATAVTDSGKSRTFVIGTAGLETLYVVVRDPRTGHPMLALGAVLTSDERWAASSLEMTDREWSKVLSHPK